MSQYRDILSLYRFAISQFLFSLPFTVGSPNVHYMLFQFLIFPTEPHPFLISLISPNFNNIMLEYPGKYVVL